MESVKDCLHLFGLRPGASWDEVNAAYRDLVRGLSGLDDGLGTYQPDPSTTRLYEQLLTASKLRPTGSPTTFSTPRSCGTIRVGAASTDSESWSTSPLTAKPHPSRRRVATPHLRTLSHRLRRLLNMAKAFVSGRPLLGRRLSILGLRR